MADYINRTALLHDIKKTVVFTVKTGMETAKMRDANKVIDCIKTAPAADVAPVVRCKDCRHMTIEYGNLRFCNVWEHINGMGDDGFCSYGERRSSDA